MFIVYWGANYDLDPKKVSKFQLCLRNTSCDEMIKNSPEKVGLTESFVKTFRYLYRQEKDFCGSKRNKDSPNRVNI